MAGEVSKAPSRKLEVSAPAREEGALSSASEVLENAAVVQDAQEHSRERLLGEQGLMADPSVRINLSAGLNLPGGLPSLSGGIYGALATAETLRPVTANGGFQARVTVRVDPSARAHEDAATVTAGVKLSVNGITAQPGLNSLAAVVSSGVEVRNNVKTFYRSMRELIAELRGTQLDELRDLAKRTAAGKQLSRKDRAKLQALTNEMGLKLTRALALLESAPKLFGEISGLVSNIESGALSVRAGVIANVHTEQTLAFRTPTLRLGDHRFDAGAQVHLVQPVALPDVAASALEKSDEWVTLRSSMVAVRADANVVVDGLDELSSAVGSARKTLSSLGRATDAAGIARTARQANDLRKKTEALLEVFDVRVEAGAEVQQATGPGIGLDELTARWRWNPSDAVEIAARGSVKHVAGAMKGESQNLRLDPETYDVAASDPVAANVYETFFARSLSVDVGASFNGGTDYKSEVLAGYATNGNVHSAHLGYVQEMGQRLGLRLGVLDPDLTRSREHVLMPMAAVDLNVGPRVSPSNVSFQLSGGAAVTMGRDQQTTVGGGQAALNLSIQLGKKGPR